jgi:hypothetical protein
MEIVHEWNVEIRTMMKGDVNVTWTWCDSLRWGPKYYVYPWHCGMNVEMGLSDEDIHVGGTFWCDWWWCKEDTLKLKEFPTFYVYLHYEERNNHNVKLDYLSTQITTSK